MFALAQQRRTAPRPAALFTSLGVVGLGLAVVAAQNLGRLIVRLMLAGALSLLGGIVIGAAVTDGGLGQLFVTGLAAMALWPPAMLGLNRLARWRRDRAGRPAPVAPARPSPPGERRAPIAWDRLARQAPAQPRLDWARTTIERSSLLLTHLPLDAEAHELRILIDKRLPELIDARLDHLEIEDPADREQAIGELVDLIDRFAEDCSERCDRMAGRIERRDLVLRRRIETHLSQGREQPF